MDPQSLSCSFCKRAQQEVKKLVAGPTVFICEICVRSYTENLTQTNERELRRIDGDRVCAFCGLQATETRYVESVEDAAVCNECLRLCNDIIGPPGDGV
jgi:ATP-dependent protease Clp ATPase subunit